MTRIVRQRLSVLAWGASLFCSVLLLISAIAAAEHKRTAPPLEHDTQPYMTAPTSARAQ
jgi:hypothetical protein